MFHFRHLINVKLPFMYVLAEICLFMKLMIVETFFAKGTHNKLDGIFVRKVNN